MKQAGMVSYQTMNVMITIDLRHVPPTVLGLVFDHGSTVVPANHQELFACQTRCLDCERGQNTTSTTRR